ncbi:MAG TPA: G1 family glutamic endopeptidase [Terracidiphilus sp.]|jgi:hypothetical protein
MKTLSSALTAALVLAAPVAIVAQNSLANPIATPRHLQPNEHALSLPGATTIEAPAADFDPISASDEELAYHGFPPRPNQNDVKAYASWAEAMQHSKTRVTPKLQQTSIYHGPAQIKKQVNTAAAERQPGLAQQPSNTYYSSNWSGYVALSGATSYGSSSYYYLINDMVVPIAQQRPGACTGGWAYGSEWNGIDGWGSSDVLQAGVEFDAYCSGTARSTFYSAWYEWYPYGEVRISGLPVTAGDDVFVEVWHTSATQGYAYLTNLNTNQSVQVGFTAPAGVSLKGNSAEWVVEAPTVGGSLATMVDYTRVPFWDSYAYTEAYAFYDVANSTAVDMEVGTTIVSYPEYVGVEGFVMHFQ